MINWRASQIAQRAAILVLISLFAFACTQSAEEASGPDASPRRIDQWAYLIPESFHASHLQRRLAGYSTLCLGVYRLNARGELYARPQLSAAAQRQLAQLRRGRRLFPLISLRGARDGAAMLRSSSARRNAAHRLAALLERESFDGLHIDFEYLGAASSTDFISFLAELRQQVVRQNSVLSIAATPPLQGTADQIAFFDLPRIAAHVDELVSMTYDYHMLSPGPVTHLYWVRKNMELTLQAFPAGRIWMGVPGYGYEWRRPGKKPRPLSESHGEELCRRYSCRREDSGTLTVIGAAYPANFADAETRRRMQSLAGELHLRGTALWRIGFEKLPAEADDAQP
ncbi:MAG: hypothetical protein K1X75_11535 [Leptospirales bacterium]|nr:hypothetical protein [Leptospirales bacterium]